MLTVTKLDGASIKLNIFEDNKVIIQGVNDNTKIAKVNIMYETYSLKFHFVSTFIFSSLAFHKNIIENSLVNHINAKTLINQTNTNAVNQTKDNTWLVHEIIKFINQRYIVSSELNPFRGGIQDIEIVEIKKNIVKIGIILAIHHSLE